MILKKGAKIGERPTGELVDILWIEPGKLVVLDRSGAFLLYDPAKSSWTARATSDGAQWGKITIAATYSGNLTCSTPAKTKS